MRLAVRMLALGLVVVFAVGVAQAPERAAGASQAATAEVYRERYVRAGDWRTLETFWNASATGIFNRPEGAEVRVKYGYGWLSFNRQRQTLDGDADRRLEIGSGLSKIGARMQMKVPRDTWVWYRLVFEGPS